MSLKMSTADMKKMLHEVVTSDETFNCTLWGVIMKCNGELLKNSLPIGMAVGAIFGVAMAGAVGGAIGALSNIYCYIGCTDTSIHIVCIRILDVSKVKEVITIPYNEINNIKIKRSLIPGRHIVLIRCFQNSHLKISVMNNAIGTDIKTQKENAQKFFDILSNVIV